MDMFPSTDSVKNAVDMFPRTDIIKWHSFYPLKPCRVRGIDRAEIKQLNPQKGGIILTTKYVVIIQCDIAHRRCSGFACTNAFYNKDGAFEDYSEDTRYISFTCGGCCGKNIASKLEHLSKKLAKKSNITKDEVVVHLSSCMVTDNHHYDRCPH